MLRFLLTLSLSLLLFNTAFAADQEAKREELIQKGVAFLRTTQAEDGSFSAQAGVGPTGIVVGGLLEVGISPDDPVVAKGLSFLQKAMQEDGGIYTAGGRFANYETCVAVMCFAAANNKIKAEKKTETGPYDELLAKSDRSLRDCQYTEARDSKPEDVMYGGAGYGKNSRPDLSNTHFFVEAIKAAGAKDDDPALQKALVFVSRCQNLESADNTLPFAAKNPDGGFIYSPVGEGSSPAGQTPDGGLRSYGSMTYAGLKSMIYAGLTPDDPRVKAAYDWTKKHYDVHSNPGLGKAGLYYYYQLMSKALDVLQVKTLETDAGAKHDWRAELVGLFAETQQPNGSWTNDDTRWLEGDPNLVTGYVLMVLADCK